MRRRGRLKAAPRRRRQSRRRAPACARLDPSFPRSDQSYLNLKRRRAPACARLDPSLPRSDQRQVPMWRFESRALRFAEVWIYARPAEVDSLLECSAFASLCGSSSLLTVYTQGVMSHLQRQVIARILTVILNGQHAHYLRIIHFEPLLYIRRRYADIVHIGITYISIYRNLLLL